MASKAQNKTTKTGASVAAFIDGIKDDARRKDAKTVLALLRRATGEKPRMWGGSIVGFGEYHYTYASGREGDWCVTGFSPRKDYLAVYLLPGLHLHADNLKKLGKIKTGKSCLYIRNLADIDLPTLERMAKQACLDIKQFTG
jgi:hypothetical protein